MSQKPTEKKTKRSRKSNKNDKHLQAPVKKLKKKFKDRFHFGKKSGGREIPEKTSTSRSVETAESSRSVDRSRQAELNRDVSRGRTADRSRKEMVQDVEPLQTPAQISTNFKRIITEPSRNKDVLRSAESVHGADHSRHFATEDSRTQDMSRVITDIGPQNAELASRVPDINWMDNLSRNMEPPRSAEVIHSRSINETSKSYEPPLGRNNEMVLGRALINDKKSSPEKASQSSSHRVLFTDSMMLKPSEPQPPSATFDSLLALTPEPQPSSTSKALGPAEQAEKVEDDKQGDAAMEQQRLKVLLDENEKANRREQQLFATKNQIIAKIDLVKKQLDNAMDKYRGEAQACREQMEKEEILQNQVVMDLKERVEKLSDICTDMNNQIDDMITTLNAYSVGEAGILYIIAACSVDFVVRIFQPLLNAINYITFGNQTILSTPTNATNKERESEKVLKTPKV